MRRSLAVGLLLLTTVFLGAANPGGPVNLDFESGAEGELPPGWISPTTAMGYTAVLSTETPKQGKQCVRVSGAPKAADDGHPVFGNIMQRIDATPYRGKCVRFRGAIRVQGESASAGLWMRVDRPQKQPGFFENMQGRPVRSAEWAYYDITGDVAGDAEVLNIGMIVEREGSAWLDDVTLAVGPAAEMRSAPPRAISARGLDNVIAFTRLCGIVRHFHPSDEAARADWNAIAVNGAAAVENAKNASELVARLETIFLPIAPSVRIYRSNAPPTTHIAKPENAQTIVMWEHKGFGQSNTGRGEKIYSSERARRGVAEAADARLPDPQQPLQVDLGGGVSASIPLAVYADASQTLPRASRTAMAVAKGEYTGNDRATRIGTVVLLWNVIQHFYPYFDVVDVDWRAELRTALTAAATDRDEKAFLGTLRRTIAAIDDGHGSVSLATSFDRASLPILWRVVDHDALVITAVDPAVSGVKVGDEVVAIGGKSALDVLREAETLISGATPQWRRWIALDRVMGGDAGSQVVLTIRNADGTTRDETLTRAILTERPAEKRPERITELEPGLWYVDLTRITDADFAGALEKLAAARGIAFDLRGYPRLGTTPLQHMIGEVAQSARWNVPLLRRPDFQGVEWVTEGRWDLQPEQPRLPKNLVFLTDGRAISYAESWMGIIEAYKFGPIVGETTAGTNGNINILSLPGGYRVVFTGMKVLKHDGSRHHGVGIAPTVPVSPTLKKIRAGRDEQLEKAIEVLSSAARPLPAR